MKNDIVIKFEKVSKKFQKGKRLYLKQALLEIFRVQKKEDFWALRDINFEIKRGETVGIIGANGSGKSTILKLIAGALVPTKGKVEVNGKIGPLIELGAGFHPELTGRENIYLNGTILGLSKKEIDEKFDDIVKFSELEDFIDTPVKHYSSGMYMRLGFAVATSLNPEILLIDEILAVGDEQFQKKCLEKFTLFEKMGKTVVLVSHNLMLTEHICKRTIWLDHAEKKFDGPTKEATRLYLREIRNRGQKNSGLSPQNTSSELEIRSVEAVDSKGKRTHNFHLNKALTIRIHFKAAQKVAYPIFGIHIHDNNGYYCHGTTTLMSGFSIDNVSGEGYINYHIKELSLLSDNGGINTMNKYHISVFTQVMENNIPRQTSYFKNAQYFFIDDDNSTQHGITYLESDWSKIYQKK